MRAAKNHDAVRVISIHALLAESDHYDNYNLHCVEISIHALLAESDDDFEPSTTRRLTFLSTLSLRRATLWVLRKVPLLGIFLSTLSLRRATFFGRITSVFSGLFLSTLSLRRATRAPSRHPCPRSISIHALLAESDRLAPRSRDNSMDFYPRSPCGERPFWFFAALRGRVFLSTLSLRRATGTFINCNSDFTHFYPRSPCGERRFYRVGLGS